VWVTIDAVGILMPYSIFWGIQARKINKTLGAV